MKTTNLQTYNNYKPSGVEWLGEIPEHWEVKKIFHFFKAEKGKKAALLTKDYCGKIKGKYPVYSGQTENNGIMSSINEYEFDFSTDGCLFSTTVGAKAMSVNYLKDKFSLSQNCMIIIKRNSKVLNKFFYYQFQPIFNFHRSLIPDHMQASFRMEDLYQFKFFLPSISEQTAIAKFLDDKTAKIDQAITIKKNQIELLKERRQILIHKAVTRGLDDNVKLKDSDVEWIGEIPEGWEIKRLKYVLNINNGSDYKHIQTTEGYPVIGSGGQFAYASEYMYDGEVVFLGRKGTIDKPLYFKGKFWAVDTMFYANSKNGNNVKFLYFVATTIPFKFYSTATALPSMTQSDLNNHTISLPSINEQEEIVLYIESATTKIATAISLKEKELEKLKEYKASLINSAVTGKIKVF